jgi:4-amino-4-deoxy-L-arabinose transferase-like glycosyltransferase
MTSWRTFHSWLAVVLVAFSFVMSVRLSDSVFERLPHLEDELAYLYQARMLARGDIVIPSPQPSVAFWQPFVIDLNGQRFVKYPLGFPAQLALGEMLGATWLVNAALAALAVALVYRLGCALFDRDVAVIAAALLAFSPMALLLNATLMGHTSALCFCLLFLYAIWRMERGIHALRWGVLAGVALGMLVANRPLAAAAVALPASAWQLGRLLGARRAWLPVLRPLLALSGVALVFSAVIPLHSYFATGSPTTNLYTLVWSYDRIGFGDDYGRNGHTLVKAFNHARYDLSLLAADLFGWQIGTLDETAVQHLQTESDYYPNLGLSGLLLLAALPFVVRAHRLRAALWLLSMAAWVALPLLSPDSFLSPLVSWVWLAVMLGWLLLPLIWAGLQGDRAFAWRYLLVGVAVSFLLMHMTYWIGSQRYSTRYYFEALGALSLLGALPLAWLAQRWRRLPMYAMLVVLLVISLTQYSLPRIGVLHGFNNVSRAWHAQLEARRAGDAPVLVIVTGTQVSWRALGSFMALTSPYLDSEVIAIYNRVSSLQEVGVRPLILQQFPEHAVIDLRADGAAAWFVEGSAD